MALKKFPGNPGADAARGLALRTDHGTQYTADHFLNQHRLWGIAPSLAFVAEPNEGYEIQRCLTECLSPWKPRSIALLVRRGAEKVLEIVIRSPPGISLQVALNRRGIGHLPKRRPADRRHARGRHRLAQVSEDVVHGHRLDDEGDDPPVRPIVGAGQRHRLERRCKP
jgi:hypothetical protein